jgi:5-methyltetrahydrofolate--homocysteine methyltransferase
LVDIVDEFVMGVKREEFDRVNREAPAEIRESDATRRLTPIPTYAQARANRLAIDWDDHVIASPWFVGRRYLDAVPLAEIARHIDWTFFFSAWELEGRFPAILDHPTCGSAARELYENAQTLLKRIIKENLLTARGVYGFWPANTEEDDIVVYRDDTRRVELTRLPMLRQQDVVADQPNLSLADFIAPRDSGVPDYIGMFAVTAGLGADALARSFEQNQDDAIMVKALADRLAEAFAEYLHAQARKDWGYGEEKQLSNDDVVAGKYRGIRPAYGSPACPDHTEQSKLFAALDAERQGLTLTESFAMLPAASVSGLYFSHPQAKYFNIGRIGRDQVESYAKRKGISIETAERWLAPHLAYQPATVPVSPGV